MRVFSSRTTLHEWLHPWCTNPNEDLGVDSDITFGPVWTDLNTHGFICLNAFTSGLMMIKKKNKPNKKKTTTSKQVAFKFRILRYKGSNLRFCKYKQCRTSCKRWGNIARANRRSRHSTCPCLFKINRLVSVDESIQMTHTLLDFAMEIRYICVLTPVAWSNSTPFLHKLLVAALHLWLKWGELEGQMSLSAVCYTKHISFQSSPSTWYLRRTCWWTQVCWRVGDQDGQQGRAT